MKNSARIKIFKSIFPIIKHEKHLYFLLAVFKVAMLVSALITPLFYKMLLNDVIIDKRLHMLLWVVVGYIGIYIFDSFIVTINKKVYNTLFLKMKISVKQQVFRKLAAMKYKDLSNYSVGDLAKRIDSDIDVIENFLNAHVLDYLYSIVSVTVISVILLFMSWRLALFGFVMIPISFLFANIMGKKAGVVGGKLRNIYGRYDTYIHNTFQNWKDIKSNNLEDNEDTIFKGYWDEISPLRIKSQILWFINRGFIAFKDHFVTRMNLYFFGGLLIINGSMEVTILLVFMNYYEKLFKNISSLTDAVVKLKTDSPSIDRVIYIIDLKCEQKQKIQIVDSNIVIDNMSFRYNDEQGNVLDDIFMKIEDKQHIAIVGRSGCGKTTLARLLLGLYQPNSGMIEIGGHDINNISSDSLNKKISIVMQSPSLLKLSFRENLLLAKKKATVEEIEVACMKANIYEFITSLPEGFDTIIGEKGIKLSGGQKQRLAIARTFLFDPDIIVFDEATSSLDSKSEKAIISSVDEIAKHKTLITIAHRLSTVISADKVFVMEKGRIVASGTHEMLKGQNEVYDMMFESQYKVS